MESICKSAIDASGVDEDCTIVFYRTNKPHTKGKCWLSPVPIIGIGISRKDYRKTMLSALFHEIGEAKRLAHIKSILFAYEQLSKICGKSPRYEIYLHLHILNEQAIDKILKQSQFNFNLANVDTVTRGNKVYIEGNYLDLLPYLDMCGGDIHSSHVIDRDYMIETQGKFPAHIEVEV
jgi:hypothetical protein